MEGSEEKEKEEAWLDDLQKNSWNPEILISGFALAFILAFPSNLYEFAASLIQDWGINFLGGWLLLLYLSGLLNVFKIFLISHLALRFIWAGLLGISYAFPRGVIVEKLFGYLQGYEYYQPKELVYKVERICSMAFGIPVIMATIFIPVTLYLLALLAIYKFFNLSFIVIYLIFLGSLIGFSIYGFVRNKLFKSKTKHLGFLGSISSYYMSHIGKWRYNLYFILIFIIAVPFVKIDVKDFFLFFNDISMDEEQISWPHQDWFFQDARDPDKRFGRILLPSQTIDSDILPIYLAYYGEDEINIKSLNKDFTNTLDTLSWHSIERVTDIYRFYLNDSLIRINDWSPIILSESKQPAHLTYLSLSGINEGFNELRVEKLIPPTGGFGISEPRLRKEWAVVRFYKKGN